jgi:hypothetical protein
MYIHLYIQITGSGTNESNLIASKDGLWSMGFGRAKSPNCKIVKMSNIVLAADETGKRLLLCDGSMPEQSIKTLSDPCDASFGVHSVFSGELDGRRYALNKICFGFRNF